jgi:predicted enzyme related to lactoylglutathione lyase
MGARTSHAPGTFSWAELATSDADGAKAFYAQIFGWEYEDNPIGDDQVYTMASRDGGLVAALYATAAQPPHWNSYVTVASADETAAKAKELGAKLPAEPFDVLDVGRMAVLTDPQGAALCIWEPRTSIGATLVNTSGAMTWNDLLTRDPAASAEFYSALFGWTTEEVPDFGGYRVIGNDERANGGMMPAPDGVPAWVPYFGHDDVAALVEQIPGLGGQVLNGPRRIWEGSIAMFRDPQGAVFCTWTGHYDD